MLGVDVLKHNALELKMNCMHIFINGAPVVQRSSASQEKMMLIYEKAEKYLSSDDGPSGIT